MFRDKVKCNLINASFVGVSRGGFDINTSLKHFFLQNERWEIRSFIDPVPVGCRTDVDFPRQAAGLKLVG